MSEERCDACRNGGTIPRDIENAALCQQHWNRYLIAWANYETSGGAHVIESQETP